MIVCFLGSPGSGKTYGMTSLLMGRLGSITLPNLPICSNFGLFLDRVEGGKVIIPHQIEMDDKMFWRWRIVNGEWKKVENYRDYGPVLYVIDEVHLLFSSRDWQQVSRESIEYFSLHRHLGDEVVIASQSLSSIDKVIRERIGVFVMCRNLAKSRVRGMTLGKKIRYEIFYSPPIGVVVTPSEVVELELKRQDYQLSIFGGSADLGRVAKGINYKWLLVGLAGLAVFVYVFFVNFQNFLVGKFTGKKKIKNSMEIVEKEKKSLHIETDVVKENKNKVDEKGYYYPIYASRRQTEYPGERGYLKIANKEYVVTDTGIISIK